MNYEAYPFRYNKENTRFQFESIGKRGVFNKVVLITPLTTDIYNLALFDYNPQTQEYDDLSITDNGDMPEVLATVLEAINVFLTKNSAKAIYFEGSSRSRTRLYQIAISKTYDPTKFDLNIYGRKDGNWLMFEPNIDFEGFLVGKSFNFREKLFGI